MREVQRMVGDYVMTEYDVLGNKAVPNPVSMDPYTLDFNNVRLYVKPDDLSRMKVYFTVST